MSGLNRREMIFGASGLMVAAGCANAVNTLPMITGSAGNATPFINTPEANLRSLVRMTASLEPVDCPWFFNGTAYMIVGEQAPVPIMKFEGLEVYWMRQISEQEYELTGGTCTFFRDLDTHKFLETWDNPLTGNKVEVHDAVQGGRRGRGFSYATEGIRPSVMKDNMPAKPLQLEWSFARDTLWMHNQTVYPPGMPPPRAQRQTMSVPRDVFADESIVSLPSFFSSTVVMPWQRWMNMGDRAGHLLWHASGAKLDNIEELPAEFLARAEKRHPDRLTANPDFKSDKPAAAH
ncbi:MAG: DUF1838 family protein [Gammaproteobacteria bacterium]|nr:DUF1838 family protein [Gammaproteobacteria bacterium]